MTRAQDFRSAVIYQLFRLDPDSDQSLQKQIVEQVVAAIAGGHIPTDTPLPSGRILANQLNVARNTVTLAYSRLKDDGYLISKERRGFFVNPEVIERRAKPPGSAWGTSSDSGRDSTL